MIDRKNVIAIVPARGGSKGLPGKNTREICGRPLLAWSVRAGLESRYVDEVIVSTDSEDIAQVALKAGAKVPFLRPSELAQDTSTSFDVIVHALDHYKKLETQFSYIALLEPTSPMRTAEDVDQALEKLVAHKSATSIVGVCKTESQNPAFLVKISETGLISGYQQTDMPVLRRQDIPDVYFFEGSLYISEVPFLLERKSFYHQRTLACEFPKWKSFEIDDVDDFTIVEALMKQKGYQ
jgi:CMP-N,N'-diacetyllegionaminic acid synthase